MKQTIILIICILATALFAEQEKRNINKIYGNGIAFSEHLLVTTGYVARHTEKMDSIFVMENNTPIIVRVEHSIDTVFDKKK